MNVIELATMQAKEGKGDDLNAAFPEALTLVTDVAAGCHGASVLRCIERPDEFIVRIEWDTVEAHEAFRASPDIAPFRAAVGAYLQEVLAVSHYEEQ